MADAASEIEQGGLTRTLKDLFAGAAGGIAQVLLGELFPLQPSPIGFLSRFCDFSISRAFISGDVVFDIDIDFDVFFYIIRSLGCFPKRGTHKKFFQHICKHI